MKTSWIVIAAVLGSLALVNAIGLTAFGRIDLTRDGAYTLSAASKETLSTLEEPITVTAYFTEDLPPPLSGHARYVRDLLQEYRSAAKGRLSFEFIDPTKQESEAEKAAKKDVKRDIFGQTYREQTSIEKELAEVNIQPLQVRVVSDDAAQTKRVYLGMVIRHGEKKEVLPAVADVRGLEYNLTTMIRRLTRKRTPVIGVLQGHEEPKLEEAFRQLEPLLSQNYEVRPVDLAGKDTFDEGIDAVWVIGPKTPLKDNELKAIDTFLMAGKSAAFFPDVVRVDPRTLEQTETTSGLEALLKTYGVTLGDKLVADAQANTVNIQERRGNMMLQMPVLYPFMPMLKKLEPGSPVSEDVSGAVFPFTASLELSAPAGTEGAVLARSSKNSWLESKPFNLDARRNWQQETITPSGPYPLVVQVSGKLKSHFGGATGTGDARIVVAGGSAFLQDSFAAPGNGMLALNIADWMLAEPALLKMRNRGMSEATFGELSDSTRQLTKVGNALGVPLLLIALGLVRWRVREGRRGQVAASLGLKGSAS